MALPSEELKAFALSQGFDSAGVCDAKQPPHRKEYEAWIDQGHHAGMAYMSRSRALRANPQTLLPSAKSILMVTLGYLQPGTSQGKTTRYAWGRDYHKVIRGKLKRVARWAEDRYGIETRPCVDSAPILERDFAQQAGLGWFGKNTMLIDTKRGSWFFLGALLLGKRFQPDSPSIGGCGTCRKCIDACPTGALVLEADRPVAVLHSQRCISYRTIEHRGDLPGDTHGWLFGCDVCQEVCPFNSPRSSAPDRAAYTKEADFAPRDASMNPDTAAILEMTETEFAKAYAGTPLMRAGLARMKRNVRAL